MSESKYSKDAFYNGKRVLITGHTGFKGSWLCRILINQGAIITGYSLKAPTTPNLFELSGVAGKITSVIGDIRDYDSLAKCFELAKPEIVFHLAAQPIVLESYNNPRYTYETNIMGTVNILECIRTQGGVKSFLNVTTDKVYHNKECMQGYCENDELNGFDPYSNSKSCSELVTSSYRQSFFSSGDVAISTARAGNVIGGGDFAADRIIPDCVRAAVKREPLFLRNPDSVRPFQHVLEPLFAYLLIAQIQFDNINLAGCYNVGPGDKDCICTRRLSEIFAQKWGEGFVVEYKKTNGPHEANFLKLDCSKIKHVLGWKPRWDVSKAIEETVEWSKAYYSGGNMPEFMDKQIEEFQKCQ